jgi:hypothetical protein
MVVVSQFVKVIMTIVTQRLFLYVITAAHFMIIRVTVITVTTVTFMIALSLTGACTYYHIIHYYSLQLLLVMIILRSFLV